MTFSLTITQPEEQIPEYARKAAEATIALYVPTRGRVKLCHAALTSWLKLAARPEKLKILIGVDGDDEESKMLSYDYPVRVFDDSIITCGGRVRDLSMAIKADIYMSLVDYYFCLTFQWDEVLRGKMLNNEIINMKCLHDPLSFNLTAVSKKWHSLATPIEPIWFPFWFSDQWRLEMHSFVFNRSPETTEEIQTAGKKERTQNLHDLDWWWGFFHALRPLRVQQSYEIAKSYSMAPPTLEEFVESRGMFINAYTEFDHKRRRGIHESAQAYGAIGVRSEKYLTAKKNAEQYAADNNLTPWEIKWNRE